MSRWIEHGEAVVWVLDHQNLVKTEHGGIDDWARSIDAGVASVMIWVAGLIVLVTWGELVRTG
jgi:hypothetical protein